MADQTSNAAISKAEVHAMIAERRALKAENGRLRAIVDHTKPIGLDKNGQPVQRGNIVRHDNGHRPPGFFEVQWDNCKIGWVLDGVGPDSRGWLREWCLSDVELSSRTAALAEAAKEASDG